MQPICPNCLRTDCSHHGDFCPECGTKMVDFNLKCKCGNEPYLTFFSSLMPPFHRSSKPTNPYCPNCGQDMSKLAETRIKELRHWCHITKVINGAIEEVQ